MKKKILIIEDDLNVRENIITLLSEEGYIVLSAKDGKSGLEVIKEDLPDLVICDIMMSGYTGYDVLERLSQINLNKVIPFIFLTAKAEKDDIRHGMQLGADDYILKPFNFDELLKSIEARFRKLELFAPRQSEYAEIISTERYSSDDKIFIQVEGNPLLIKIGNIIYIKAENQYSCITLIGGKSHVVRKSLSLWECSLPLKNFLRIHRSTIINLDYLLKIEKWYNTSLLVYLKDTKEPFIISKRYSAKLRKSFF